MVRYNIKTGIKNIKTKTAVAVSAVTLGVCGFGMAVVVPAISHAAPSASGACHGAFANVNGSFGFLGGLHGTPYYNGDQTIPGDRAVGQQPTATGYNNSQGC
jgi:hypothetical protein